MGCVVALWRQNRVRSQQRAHSPTYPHARLIAQTPTTNSNHGSAFVQPARMSDCRRSSAGLYASSSSAATRPDLVGCPPPPPPPPPVIRQRRPAIMRRLYVPSPSFCTVRRLTLTGWSHVGNVHQPAVRPTGRLSVHYSYCLSTNGHVLHAQIVRSAAWRPF